MQTILFHSTIFGPIHSRRLGTSLGVNLMPADGKVCSFDCLYCEAGFNAQGPGLAGLPPRGEVSRRLEEKLRAMKEAGESLDVITFSGNGEPTLHPDFPAIIDDTLALRDRYFPDVKVSVLTNSTRIFSPEVAAALDRVDNNILKIDSAVEQTMRTIDRPADPTFTVERLIEGLKRFRDTGVLQVMMLRGEGIDNTVDAELDALADAIRRIQPREVMVYSLDRPTPDGTLRRVGREELEAIAARLAADTGVHVYAF